MHFGDTDHVDMSGIPPAVQVEERLRLDTMKFGLAFGNVGFHDVRQAAQQFAAEVRPAFDPSRR